jgi:hypothetical protein
MVESLRVQEFVCRKKLVMESYVLFIVLVVAWILISTICFAWLILNSMQSGW